MREKNKHANMYSKYVLYEIISETVLLFYNPERKTFCIIETNGNKI